MGDDREPTRPGPDASLPTLLGHAIGRHATFVRVTAGLALTIASLGMLGLFVGSAAVPFHDERSTPPIGQVCVPDGVIAPTGDCFDVDEDRLDQSFEDDI